MSEPCSPLCPFADCPDCPWKGGTVAPQGVSHEQVCDNGGGKDERPTASTVDRSSRPRFALPNERSYPTW